MARSNKMKRFNLNMRAVKAALIVAALIIAALSLVVSNILIKDLTREETAKMEVWAEAMRSLTRADENTDLNLVLRVLNGNNTIPVIVLDGQGRVLAARNIGIPKIVWKMSYLMCRARVTKQLLKICCCVHTK